MQPQPPRDPRLPPGINMPPPGIYFPHPPYGLGPATGHIDGEQWARDNWKEQSDAAITVYGLSIFMAIVTVISLFFPWQTVTSKTINLSISINGLNQLSGSINGETGSGTGIIVFPVWGFIIALASVLIFFLSIFGMVSSSKGITIAIEVSAVIAAGIYIWRIIDFFLSNSNKPSDTNVVLGYGLYIGFAAVLITILINMYLLFAN